MALRKVKIVAACHDASGIPDFAMVEVEVDEEDMTVGRHYDEALNELYDMDYIDPIVLFDADDAPKFLFPEVEKYLGVRD